MANGDKSKGNSMANDSTTSHELEFVLHELVPFIHGEKASNCGVSLPLKREDIGGAWENAILNGRLDDAKTLGEIMLRYEKLCNSYKDAHSPETEAQAGISLNDLAAYEVMLRTASKRKRKGKNIKSS